MSKIKSFQNYNELNDFIEYIKLFKEKIINSSEEEKNKNNQFIKYIINVIEEKEIENNQLYLLKLNFELKTNFNELKKLIKNKIKNFSEISTQLIELEKEKLEKNLISKEEFEKKKNLYEKTILKNEFKSDLINDKEVNKIEEWTNLKCEQIIFDSNIHNWKQKESKFDSLIFNKQNLIFLIETEDNIKFGGFISSKIDKIYSKPKWEKISDENAFIFTFKDDKLMKFDIKKDKTNDVFWLWDNSYDILFKIGFIDIIIGKQNKESSICQNDYCQFDYKENKNALIGKTGTDSCKQKRILVIQMRSENEIDKYKEEKIIKEIIQNKKEDENLKLKEEMNKIKYDLKCWQRVSDKMCTAKNNYKKDCEEKDKEIKELKEELEKFKNENE